MTAHKALSTAIAELPRVKCHVLGNEAEIRQDKLLHTSSHLTKSNHVALGVAMHVGHDGSGSSLPRRFWPWPPIDGRKVRDQTDESELSTEYHPDYVNYPYRDAKFAELPPLAQ